MNVGLFWAGKSERQDYRKFIEVYPGDVIIRQGRPVMSGVTGMCDGAGFVPITITADMVGTRIARSLWIEDKTGKGQTTKEQKSFIQMVRSFGGLAGCARSDEDVARIIRGEIVD